MNSTLLHCLFEFRFVNMTIQTQAFTPPEFQPLKICTYKPTSKAKNKYFKLINT